MDHQQDAEIPSGISGDFSGVGHGRMPAGDRGLLSLGSHGVQIGDDPQSDAFHVHIWKY